MTWLDVIGISTRSRSVKDTIPIPKSVVALPDQASTSTNVIATEDILQPSSDASEAPKQSTIKYYWTKFRDMYRRGEKETIFTLTDIHKRSQSVADAHTDDVFKFMPYPTAQQRVSWLLFKNEFGFRSFEINIVGVCVVTAFVAGPLLCRDFIRGLKYLRNKEGLLHMFNTYREHWLSRGGVCAAASALPTTAVSVMTAYRDELRYVDIYCAITTCSAAIGLVEGAISAAYFGAFGVGVSAIVVSPLFLYLKVNNQTLNEFYAGLQQKYWERQMRDYLDIDLLISLSRND